MLAGVAWLVGIYSVIVLLHVLLPGRWVEGYVEGPDGRPLRYRLNGLRVFVIVAVAYVALAAGGVVAWDALYPYRFTMLATACALGFVFTAAVVLLAPAGTARTAGAGRSLAADLFLGRIENPQWLARRVDVKMLLYLVGAVMLELLLATFAAHHIAKYPTDPSPGVILYVALFTFFLVEYLFFEQVHLYTYDFVAERVGFKLGWGCLVFYPFFYGIGLWYAADLPNPHVHPAWLAICAAIFFAGWTFARGANLQKYRFKTQPERTTFGPFAQRSLGDGKQRVLVSGFWGLSRHVNYLGELLMATGLTLSLGIPGAVLPWLYPLYYVALLVPRQLDDDRRCAEKYGRLWDEYRREVRYRIVPFIY
jgi:Ergosterol biosynthesis ERG4/ERG24 family